MKILIVGDWHSDVHEEGMHLALETMGHAPEKFAWHSYFRPQSPHGKVLLPLLRLQNKYMLGPRVARLNHDLVERVHASQPDLVFIYRGSHVQPATLGRLRAAAPAAAIVGYNNDDPFSPAYPRWKWRHFIATIPYYDLLLAYRQCNLQDFTAAGAHRVELLRSWFIPERHHPLALTEQEQQRYGCDVVFVGHYEDDGRLTYLEDIVRAGWTLKIFGPGYQWDRVLAASRYLRHQPPVTLVWGGEYNRALCGAKTALCFLSKLNRDTYTRRCFEIPASRTLLLSEYSEDLTMLFAADREAVFFRSRSELSARLEVIMGNPAYCSAIAQAGERRVWRDGHDIYSRMDQLCTWVEQLKRRPG